MRLVGISDTHGQHRAMKHSLPDGDVLVHTGDCLRTGKNVNELIDFYDWFSNQPHRYKVQIAGNHDWFFQTNPSVAQSLIPTNIIYLQDSFTTICGKVFYGAPWTPVFFSWAFMKARGPHIKRVWDQIPLDTDILITHGPAYGHGDLAPPFKTRYARNAGCLELLHRIKEVQPQLHIFGHIHCAYGITQSDEIPMTTFANVSTCNEQYAPINLPIVIDIN
jgi:Icc-related predicted phosphoesterase